MTDDAARAYLADRWREHLAGWAIPGELTRVVASEPFALDPAMLAPHFAAPLTPTQAAILELTGEDRQASVLDVGAGRGAAVLPIADRLGSVLAVDQRADMLEALVVDSERIPSVMVETRVGDFLALEPSLGSFDVVTSQHMIYNVADLFGYLEGLLRHARRGVVLEMTAKHPFASLELLFWRLHGLERPPGPTVADVLQALRLLGCVPRIALAPDRPSDPVTRLASTRQRLALPKEREPELAELLAAGYGLPNPSVTVVVVHGN
jgi:ubiquinone/menaquinone biosynthesis C-methylase UbiE